MPSWKGNPKNPAPNEVHETIDRAEKLIDVNRAQEIRRDTDDTKNRTIGLQDIDGAILYQLENLQLQVVDAGKVIKVPFFFGPPERWVSAKRDGYIRDKQGKLILPAIILKRTNSADDTTLQFFNRYLNASVMKRYSEKNQYTKFAALSGQNVPVNEVYNIVVPSHMILTYHFIMWTEYVEQMNELVQTIRFNTKDYWGSKNGFRFRVRVENYDHTVELEAGEDRVVKTEFDLVVHGYILPDSMTKLESHEMTIKKAFTPKKIVLGMEVVATDYNLKQLDDNRQKWRNAQYPNLPADEKIPGPPVSVNTSIVNDYASGIQVENAPLFLRIVPVPVINSPVYVTTYGNSSTGSNSLPIPLAYYKFDSITGGNQLLDEVGNQNPLTIQGTVPPENNCQTTPTIITPGKIGNGLQLVPYLPNLGQSCGQTIARSWLIPQLTSNSMTCRYWFKVSQSGNDNSEIYIICPTAEIDIYYLNSISNPNQLDVYVYVLGATHGGLHYTFNVPDDYNWHRMVFEMDYSNQLAYVQIDEQTMQSQSISASFPYAVPGGTQGDQTFYIYMGSYTSGSATQIDEFGIWNSLLTNNQLTYDWNNGNGITYPYSNGCVLGPPTSSYQTQSFLKQFAQGQDGDMSYDENYFYLKTDGVWKRVALSEFTISCSDNVPLVGLEGQTSVGSQYFYIYADKMWRRVATQNTSITNLSGKVAFDGNYIYLNYNGQWKQIALAKLT